MFFLVFLVYNRFGKTVLFPDLELVLDIVIEDGLLSLGLEFVLGMDRVDLDRVGGRVVLDLLFLLLGEHREYELELVGRVLLQGRGRVSSLGATSLELGMSLEDVLGRHERLGVFRRERSVEVIGGVQGRGIHRGLFRLLLDTLLGEQVGNLDTFPLTLGALQG